MNIEKTIMLSLCICVLPLRMAIGQNWAGSGTLGDPWQVSNAVTLAQCDDEVTFYDDHFILVNNIDCSTDPGYALWQRPDNARRDGIPTTGSAVGFGGTFDGQGYAISNRVESFLDSQRPPYNGTPAIFRNIVFTNTMVTPHPIQQGSGVCAVSPFEFGGSNPSFFNIQVYGVVSNNSSGFTGGMIANGSAGTVSNCISYATVYGLGSVGGLAGSASGTTIKNSHAYGDVSATSTDAGGLVGLLSGGGVIYQCSAHGDVHKSAGEYEGGLVGRILNGGTVRECFATGDVLRKTGVGIQAGGLVGGTQGSSGAILIEDCYSTGDNPSTQIYSPGRNGGFVAEFGREAGSSSHLINRCYSTGDVGASDAGGFMGRSSSGGGSGVVISNSFQAGSMVANSSGGFAISSGFSVTIANCYWTNSASSDAVATKVGNASHFYDKANSPVDTWDSDSIWYFSSAANPCLRWQDDCNAPPKGSMLLFE
jgi:hypothetical protein